jgi:hypothetical protein
MTCPARTDAILAQPDPPCSLNGGCPYAALCGRYKLACESFYAYQAEPASAYRPHREWRTMPRVPSTEWYTKVYGGSISALIADRSAKASGSSRSDALAAPVPIAELRSARAECAA